MAREGWGVSSRTAEFTSDPETQPEKIPTQFRVRPARLSIRYEDCNGERQCGHIRPVPTPYLHISVLSLQCNAFAFFLSKYPPFHVHELARGPVIVPSHLRAVRGELKDSGPYRVVSQELA